MNSDQLLLICAGLGLTTGIGLLLVITALYGRQESGDASTRAGAGTVWRARLAGWQRPGLGRRLALAVVVAVGVGALTGWPVGGVLAAGLVWWLPRLLGPDHEHAVKVARIEAVATWTESLRDTLSAAAGLEQAVLATARRAPQPIAEEVGRLVTRVDRGARLGDALAGFADDLDDPTADLVVAALVMAADRNARQLGDLLGLLATTSREQAALRLRVAAGRSRMRTSVRVIVMVTLAMAIGLGVLNRGYLAPYDSALGQLVLLIIGAVFAAAYTGLQKMAGVAEAPRLLTALTALTTGQRVTL